MPAQVVYSVVMQDWSLRDWSLGLETSQFKNLSLGLGFGLGTSRPWSWHGHHLLFLANNIHLRLLINKRRTVPTLRLVGLSVILKTVLLLNVA